MHTHLLNEQAGFKKGIKKLEITHFIKFLDNEIAENGVSIRIKTDLLYLIALLVMAIISELAKKTVVGMNS